MEGPLHPISQPLPLQDTTLQRAPELARQVVLRASWSHHSCHVREFVPVTVPQRSPTVSRGEIKGAVGWGAQIWVPHKVSSPWETWGHHQASKVSAQDPSTPARETAGRWGSRVLTRRGTCTSFSSTGTMSNHSNPKAPLS